EPDVRLYRLSGDLARHGGGSAAGLARSIGVSNFNQDMMERIRSTGCRRRPCCRSSALRDKPRCCGCATAAGCLRSRWAPG
ncbi:hypothetical protein MSG28_015245, partial [Choristoneura fumiferana]